MPVFESIQNYRECVQLSGVQEFTSFKVVPFKPKWFCTAAWKVALTFLS